MLGGSALLVLLLLLISACGQGAGRQGGISSESTELTESAEQTENASQARAFAQNGSAEEPVVLTVTGDGVRKETAWTRSQLQALREAYLQVVYSTTNNWPAFGYIEAQGISLTRFLRLAELLNEAACFSFVSADGYKATVTFDQLFGDDRYTFADHSVGGSGLPAAAEPILAWAWGDPGRVEEENIRPFFGQAGPWDVNTACFVKDLCRIEVSTASPGVWEAPGASIPDGSTVPAGTELELLHDRMDNIRIYYTLDGSEPDCFSPVYNPSASYFQPELILPLTLTESVTVKAFAAGYGKDKSPVATFSYRVEQATPSEESAAWEIRVTGPSGEEAFRFTEPELADALQKLDSPSPDYPRSFGNSYSTINNWPAARFYAADGYTVASILELSGLYDLARTVTFRGEDGYEISLTREQLLTPQYSYPRVNESDEGAELVFPLIAYRWREGTDDLRALRDAKPSLIIGQRNPFEHTNPAFVIGVTEILVSDAACEAWPAATTFPLPGLIAAGETVKLQHPDFGLVKMHYTLDGSAPTVLSPMYNPSTYQPELNAPIPILEPTVIRVLVTGYGKEDSEIATFYFTTN